jgi:ATP-dependent 26S proteasome regulatory subunit
VNFGNISDQYNFFFNASAFEKAYSSNNEFLGEVRALLDMYISVVLHLNKENREPGDSQKLLSRFSFKGIVITDTEVENIMLEFGKKNKERKLTLEQIDDFNRAWVHLENRVAKTKGVKIPLAKFLTTHDFSRFEKLYIIIGMAIELDRKYERLFAYIQDDNTAKFPTYGLVLALILITEPIERVNVYEAWNNPLIFAILDDGVKKNKCSVLMTNILLKGKVVSLFAGNFEKNPLMKKFTNYYCPTDELDPLAIREEFNEKLSHIVSETLKSKPACNLIHIFGENGVGKRFHLKHVAKKLRTPIVFIDFSYLLCTGLETAINLVETLALEALFEYKFIVLYNAILTDEEIVIQNRILDELLDYGNLIFILNNTAKLPISDHNRHKSFEDIEIKPLSMRERLKMWDKMSKKYEFQDEIDFKNISNKFNYTPGQIQAIFHKASVISGGQIKGNVLSDVCKNFSIHNLESKATLIDCKYTFDDLVIEEDQKKLLKDVCNYIKYKDIIYESWDFSSKIAYGRGLSMIFYGPPGTGKTMGAQIIANELDLQLYRVDVSQIMNKYVGETEKNLKGIFAEAKTSNAILLFDEADSLFGKRTDVKDSNDKFSNNEISFLLQQMEEYDGVSILTTNKFNNFDNAFRRRIKFFVNFPLPSVSMRKLLWTKIFPKKAPLDDDFDPEILAEKFDLSGSSIKSVALFAAYLAVSEGKKITQELVINAIKYEYQKLGKVVPSEYFYC